MFMENNMLDPFLENSLQLKRLLELWDIKYVITKAKNGKPSGYAGILFEVLNNSNTFYNLSTSYVFVMLILSDWRRSMICPISKESSSDPHM